MAVGYAALIGGLFNLGAKDRMPLADILGLFDEFLFLHRYVGRPASVHSVEVSWVDKLLLSRQARGKKYHDPAAPNEGHRACQIVRFVFLDKDGNEIGQVQPWTWVKWVWLRKILERSIFFLPPGFRSSPTLMEVLQRDHGVLESACYIAEFREQGYVTGHIVVHKMPGGQSLPEMIGGMVA